MACFPGAVLSVLWSTGLLPSPTPSSALLFLQLPVLFWLFAGAHQTPCLPLPTPSWHISPSPRCHPEEVAVRKLALRLASIFVVVITITIIVIISQMRGAKLELCPSPSSWLTVTNSSFIHYAHHLSTGQRRQEPAESPPLHRGLEGTALCNGVSSASSMSPSRHSVRAERKQLVSHAWMSNGSSTVEGETVLPT